MRVRTATALRLVEAAVVLALSISYFAYVFRLTEGRFFRVALGDWVDPNFINFLLEHWRHSILTLSDPSSPPMYFPVRGTLGYSHGLILFAPFYVAARALLAPLQAYNMTLLLVMEAGALCVYSILRKLLGLRPIESLALSALFFTSANVVNGGTGVWSQRASVFLIPPILLVALASMRLPPGRLRLALAGVSGLLVTLMFTQDFYTGALAALTGALLLAGVLIVAPPPAAVRSSAAPSGWWLAAASVSLAWAVFIGVRPIPRTAVGPFTFSATDATRPLAIAVLAVGWYLFRRSGAVERMRSVWRRDPPSVVAFAAGLCLGGLAFLWIYLGPYREHPEFPPDHLLGLLIPADVWRTDWTAIGVYDSLRPFVLVVAIAILAWLPMFALERRERLFCVWVLLVSLIVLAIPLRFGGFSVWKVFFAPLPGLSAIRDPKRVIEVYELAVALLAGLFVARRPSTSPLRFTVVLLVCVLLATAWNRSRLDFERPVGLYNAWVEAPIDIDPSCRSFFVRGASDAYMSRSFHKWSLYAMDSMFIALKHSIPTLNGYSAWWPDGWGLSNPQEPGYAEAVARWIDRHQLRDVCELDIEARTMRPYVPARRSIK